MYCGGVVAGKGDLAHRDDDPTGLRFVDAGAEAFERYSPLGRLRSELRYGRSVAALLRGFRPDAVLSANTPLLAQAAIWRSARRAGARRVYWLQDLLGVGTRAVLARRSALLGATAGAALERLETSLLRRSDAHVVITDAFVGELERRGVRGPVRVVRNWAPTDEIVERPKVTPWSEAAGFAGQPLAVYAGTLGLKHDPLLLRAAAEGVDGVGHVLVLTEGIGRDALEASQRERRLPNLHLADYVPYEQLPDVLGAADVCLALLEPDAGAFSVPSKVLAYLAAGRPVVAAVPAENLAAEVLGTSGGGIVVGAGDREGFAAAVRSLLADPDRARAMGAAGRAYAEESFDVERIADRFESLLAEVIGG